MSATVPVHEQVVEPDRGPLTPRSWMLVLVRAVLLVLLGLYALVWPVGALVALVALLAVFMLFNGVLAVACAWRESRRHRRAGTLFFEGAIGIVAGVLAFAWPGITLLVLVLLAGVWGVLSGISMLVAASRHKAQRGRGLLLASGVLSMLWGVLLIVSPAAGAIVMALWTGAFAIVLGLLLLSLALVLRRDAKATLEADRRPAAA